MNDALRLAGIHKHFDGFAALTDAQFALRQGEVHALLGENGAGKSSLMNIAAGLYAPEAGQLFIDDNPVRLQGPRDAARHHIGMVHQHFKLVAPFTVAENVLLACGEAAAGGGSHRARLAAVRAQVVARAEALGFAIDVDQRVGALSVAEQQRVEILKALVAGARILILDEPTAVLTDDEAQRLLQTMRRLADQGAAIALVTHKIADVRRHADRVTVMRAGRTVATLDPRSSDEAALVRLAVGETVAAPAAQRSTPGAARLQVEDLRLAAAGSGTPPLDRLSLQLRAGEVYGLAGVGGNGQGELVQALLGLRPLAGGRILLHGSGDLAGHTPAQRRALGLAVVPADRQGLALAGALSVAENFGITQAVQGRFGSLWRLDKAAMAAAAQTAVAAFDVLGVRSLAQKAALLSGGNAQKLVLARELAGTPAVLVAHSPSRGLDVRATAQVHARLLAARDASAAVLLISEDLDEVLALADRVGVIVRGRIVATFDAPAERQAVGRAMVTGASSPLAEGAVA